MRARSRGLVGRSATLSNVSSTYVTMALVSYSVKSPCWRIGTRLNGGSARLVGLPISGWRSRNVYETSLWVSTSRTICTKVLRGNPSTIGSDISFLPVSAQRGPSHADGRRVYGILIHMLQDIFFMI